VNGEWGQENKVQEEDEVEIIQARGTGMQGHQPPERKTIELNWNKETITFMTEADEIMVEIRRQARMKWGIERKDYSISPTERVLRNEEGVTRRRVYLSPTRKGGNPQEEGEETLFRLDGI
jgi:hypothetical protein